MENIKWGELGFAYYKTAFNVRYHYANGQWSQMQVTDDEYIKMHMSAACLHYGLEIFEGLKPSVVLMVRYACSVPTRTLSV